MISHSYKISILAVLTIATAPSLPAQAIYPKRVLANESTGYLESYVSGEWYRGSGVVARDPKLIFSCGHLFYENGVWATKYLFYRAYHDSSYPDTAVGAAPRGFRYFTTYANNAAAYGTDSPATFAYDFTVFYGTNSFGPAAGCWSDGGTALRSSQAKRIVGYPSSIEYTNAPGYNYQHATDWFSRPASQVNGAFHTFDNVSTGPGNSGGPVFVRDSSDSQYYLGGILVAGTRDSAGVYALNDASNNLAASALGQQQSLTYRFRNASSQYLPDASRTFATRWVYASGFSGNVTTLKFSLSVTTARRGDLDIYLRSPSGRIRWVKKHSSDTTNNIWISNADYTSTFRGYAANGTWSVKLRDAVAGTRAKYNSFSVVVTAPSQ